MEHSNSLILILFLSVFAYSSVEGSTCNCSHPFTVATFNTDQIFTSSDQNQRLNATVNFFKQPPQQDIDVLCLQELWDPNQRDAVISALNSTFPFSFHAPQFPQKCNGCTVNEITPLRECLDQNNCFNNVFDIVKCLLDDCRHQFEHTSLDCQNCIHNLENTGDFRNRFNECLTIQESGNCTYLFGGWSDNLMLSKTPLLGTSFLLYHDSPLAEWTVLYAQVNVSTFHVPANIFCTHLSAQLPVINTIPDNANQIRQLISYIDTKVPNKTAPTFVMGDFNTGPAVDGLDGTAPQNFMIFVDSGFESTLLGANQTVCTFCGSSNPLAAESTNQNWMIDHIFVNTQEHVCVVNATRFADSNNLTTLSNGNTIPLSDHYAVRATFCEGQLNLKPQ